MFDLREYLNRPKKLAHRLPWCLMVAPGIVLNKTGAFQETIEFRGPDLFSSTGSELEVLADQVNSSLKRLGSGWAYFVELQRRLVDRYKIDVWPNKACEILDRERAELFRKKGESFENKYYLTFTYIPPSQVQTKLLSKFFSNSSKETNYQKSLDYFQAEVIKITDILGSVLPSVKYLDDDETLTYLHSTISTKKHVVKCPEVPIYLDAILADEPVVGGLEPKIGNKFFKVISIKGFPLESEPCILDEMGKTGCELRWMSRFILLNKDEAVNELKRYGRAWFAKRKPLWGMVKEVLMNEDSEANYDRNATNNAAECEDAAEVIQSGVASGGYFTTTVIVMDEDEEKAREKAREIEAIINSAGFVTVMETFNAVHAWLGSLPGHCNANIRRPLINSFNFTHMFPLSAEWNGVERNEHLEGPPLFIAETQGNTPFGFSNHVSDVGHTMIVGPTGTGKSVLLSFMATCFLRYEKAHVYFFDKDFSAYCTTKIMGGTHYNLGDNDNLAFQPLRGIDNESDRSWAQEWLVEILAQENIEITPGVKKELWEALSNLSEGPEQQRTLTGLNALVQNKEVRDALYNYTIDGQYGHLIDADTDSMEKASWQCFEMGHIINNYEKAVVPILSYVFNEIEKSFKGQPCVILLDECWLFFDTPAFRKKIKEWLKVLRKKNCSVVFATQSLSDISGSEIVSTLIESCPTRIFLPNRKALEPEIAGTYKTFGLNQKQIEIIAKAIPKREYYCQSDVGQRLFSLGLGRAGIAVCGSSDQKDIEKMRKICAAHREPVRPFFEYKGVQYEQ